MSSLACNSWSAVRPVVASSSLKAASVGAKTVYSPLPSVASRPVASSAEARIEKFGLLAATSAMVPAADVVLLPPVVVRAVDVVVPVDVTLPVEVTAVVAVVAAVAVTVAVAAGVASAVAAGVAAAAGVVASAPISSAVGRLMTWPTSMTLQSAMLL